MSSMAGRFFHAQRDEKEELFYGGRDEEGDGGGLGAGDAAGGRVPNVEKELPTAKYKVDRLSELAGHDVVFTLRALPYGKTHDLARFTQDADVNILLAGCAEPDLKDPRLMEKFGGATPAEAVKRMLLPGEIADLGMAVEKLSGYRRVTITEVKNG